MIHQMIIMNMKAMICTNTKVDKLALEQKLEVSNIINQLNSSLTVQTNIIKIVPQVHKYQINVQLTVSMMIMS